MKKKIVFNSWPAAFFQKGGGEVQLLKSKESLERKGNEILFYNPWAPQIDVDVLHQFSTEFGVEGVVKKYKEFGKKIALSPIMWVPPTKGTFFYDRVKEMFDLSDILLTNSQMEATVLSEHFGINTSKFYVTRNSISDAYFSLGESDLFRKKYQVEGDFILSVANIDKRKNTHQLVEACKKLDLRLITIGHVKDPIYYSSFKDSYSGYMHLESIENEEVLKSAYSGCLLFALPSLFETPGIAALEAASQGARIVITSEGSTSEYFQKYATYVDPMSLESIVLGIESCLNSKRDSNLLKMVVENYTWEKTGIEILEAYSRILS